MGPLHSCWTVWTGMPRHMETFELKPMLPNQQRFEQVRKGNNKSIWDPELNYSVASTIVVLCLALVTWWNMVIILHCELYFSCYECGRKTISVRILPYKICYRCHKRSHQACKCCHKSSRWGCSSLCETKAALCLPQPKLEVTWNE